MKLSPRLSIVIPFYNEAACLEARERLHCDFADNWELIIEDDGSSDATPILINNLTHQGMRASHLHPDSGQSAALQVGYAASRGELIATVRYHVTEVQPHA
jgi:glycosyltransferase involved in cell wall biosynthesis